MVGATLGAGVSSLQGDMGLLIDTLESVEFVTANGSIVTTSATMNADLFWGIRGAGTNFGIVTSATYRVSNFINNGEVLNANFMFPASACRSIWEILKYYDEALPSHMAINIAAMFNPIIQEVSLASGLAGYETTRCILNPHQIQFVVNTNYFGPVEDGMPYLSSLIALGPLRTEILTVPWNRVIPTSYFGLDKKRACKKGQYINMYSIGRNRTDIAIYESFVGELTDFSLQHPDIVNAFVIHRCPTQAVLAVPDEATAYPHRHLNMHMYVSLSVPFLFPLSIINITHLSNYHP